MCSPSSMKKWRNCGQKLVRRRIARENPFPRLLRSLRFAMPGWKRKSEIFCLRRSMSPGISAWTRKARCAGRTGNFVIAFKGGSASFAKRASRPARRRPPRWTRSGNARRKSKKKLASDDGIVIRDCSALEEFRQCVALQRAVWGFEDEDLIPTRFFVVARKIEGQVIGAFEA